MRTVLNLRPGSGLCNRLQMMNGGIRLARELNEELKIFWFYNPIPRYGIRLGMNERFTSCFHPVANVRLRESIFFSPLDYYRYSSFNKFLYTDTTYRRFVADFKAARDRDKLTLWTCYDFYHNSDFTWLIPLEHIQRQINDVAERFVGTRTIGLHVRRTDNKNAILGSPLSLFVACAEREVDNDSSVKMFLATDDAGTKMAMKQRFGARVITRDHTLARYSLRGVQDGVVDLFLLAKTNKIYGSLWSSFSECAAQIGRIPLEMVTERKVAFPSWYNEWL